MHIKKFILFVFVLIGAVACSPEVVEVVVDEAGYASEAPIEGDLLRASGANQQLGFSDDSGADFDTADSTGNAPAPQTETQIQERLIIRTAELNLVVEDTDDAIDAITNMVESNDGWVVSSNVYEYSALKRGSINVRVPSSGFNNALATFKELALEVTNESISGQDVTEEFVDLSLRLENLEATADRVRAFLDDASKVEDALAVNQELSRLEGEIELIKGRREFLSQSAQYSTIRIELIPDELNQPIEIAGWQPRGIAKEAIEALVEALQGFGGFVIWLVIFLLPLVLLYGVPLYFVGRFINRWRLRRRAQRAAVTPTEE